MTVQFNQLPTYDQPILGGKSFSRPWFVFLSNLFTGKPPASENSVVTGTSPFTYTAARRGFLIVQGGTVSMVQWARGTTNHNTGQTQGTFPLSQGDSLVITYTGAPTLTFAPQ